MVKTILLQSIYICLFAFYTLFSALRLPPVYEFLSTIEPSYAKGPAVFIKMLDNNMLVVCDARGCGEVFDGDQDYQTVYTFKIPADADEPFYIRNIFFYVDNNNEELLVLYGEKEWFYVVNVSQNSLSKKCHVGFPFRIFQRNDGDLVLINDQIKKVMLIDPSWQDEYVPGEFEQFSKLPCKHQMVDDTALYAVKNNEIIGHFKALYIYKTVPFLPYHFCAVSSLYNHHMQPQKLVYSDFVAGCKTEFFITPLCFHIGHDDMLFAAYSTGQILIWDKTAAYRNTSIVETICNDFITH